MYHINQSKKMKKTIFTIILMTAWAANMAAQSVDDLYKEFKGKENVEYIEVPKVMMSMASSFVKKDDGGDFIKRIDHVRILNIENDSQLCNTFAQKAMNLKRDGYETMVNSNEDNEKTLILVKTKKENITEMVVLDIEPNECSLIQIKGKLRPSDIEKLNN